MNYSVICADMKTNDNSSLNDDTVASYVKALKKIFVVEDREGLIEEGAANLKSLAEKIDTTKMKAPSFMMVLTGTGAYAYRRKDGVYVVPIGCLKD